MVLKAATNQVDVASEVGSAPQARCHHKVAQKLYANFNNVSLVFVVSHPDHNLFTTKHQLVHALTGGCQVAQEPNATDEHTHTGRTTCIMATMLAHDPQCKVYASCKLKNLASSSRHVSKEMQPTLLHHLAIKAALHDVYHM